MAENNLSHSSLPVTRAAAKACGSKRYFTGKPCKHGHIAYRLASSTGCSVCVKSRIDPAKAYEKTKEWRKANPGARTEEARRYRKKYPEKVAATAKRYWERHKERRRPIEAARARAKRKNDPEGNRIRMARFKAKKEAKLAEIAGRPRPRHCEVCNGSNGGIVFDHCHNKGHFRGWICDRCNKILGLVRDNPALLRDLARYLEKDDERTYGESAEQDSEFGFRTAIRTEIPFE